jgi:ATP-dependent RNA helicase DDX60
MEIKVLQQKAKIKKQGVKQEADTQCAREATLTEKQLIEIL